MFKREPPKFIYRRVKKIDGSGSYKFRSDIDKPKRHTSIGRAPGVTNAIMGQKPIMWRDHALAYIWDQFPELTVEFQSYKRKGNYAYSGSEPSGLKPVKKQKYKNDYHKYKGCFVLSLGDEKLVFKGSYDTHGCSGMLYLEAREVQEVIIADKGSYRTYENIRDKNSGEIRFWLRSDAFHFTSYSPPHWYSEVKVKGNNYGQLFQAMLDYIHQQTDPAGGSLFKETRNLDHILSQIEIDGGAQIARALHEVKFKGENEQTTNALIQAYINGGRKDYAAMIAERTGNDLLALELAQECGLFELAIKILEKPKVQEQVGDHKQRLEFFKEIRELTK